MSHDYDSYKSINSDGYNAIHLAAMKNSGPALRIILTESISNNRNWLIDEQVEDGSTALHFSTINSTNSDDSIQVLLDHGANPDLSNNLGQTPLHLACINENAFSIRTLVKFNSTVNIADINGYSPLHEIIKVMTH
jgi:ankyrin repeat protein